MASAYVCTGWKACATGGFFEYLIALGLREEFFKRFACYRKQETENRKQY
jgi:hypothetical protein